eukprot:gene12605-biopygen3430
MNSCHEEGVHDRNRAGIEAADPARSADQENKRRLKVGMDISRVISRCGKGGVRLYPGDQLDSSCELPR